MIRLGCDLLRHLRRPFGDQLAPLLVEGWRARADRFLDVLDRMAGVSRAVRYGNTPIRERGLDRTGAEYSPVPRPLRGRPTRQSHLADPCRQSADFDRARAGGAYPSAGVALAGVDAGDCELAISAALRGHRGDDLSLAAGNHIGTGALLGEILDGCADELTLVADRLLETFGSLGGVLGADPDALRAISNERAVARVSAVRACLVHILRPPPNEPLVLDDMRRLVDYLTVAGSYAQVEEVRVLFLDARLRLIRDELMSRGCIAEAPIYIRPILKRALDLGAASIVLSHNHPSGDPAPSAADETATRDLANGLDAIGLHLVDHLIVARGNWFSFRAEGLLN